MSTLYSTLSFFVICIAWLFYNFPSVVPMYLLVKSHIYIYIGLLLVTGAIKLSPCSCGYLIASLTVLNGKGGQ